MNNENNNGVIDFDSSLFFQDNTTTNNEPLNQDINIANNTNNNEANLSGNSHSNSVSVSDINVDDIFGTWSDSDSSTQAEVKPIGNDYNNSEIIPTENLENISDSEVSSQQASSSNDVTDSGFNPFESNIPYEMPKFQENANTQFGEFQVQENVGSSSQAAGTFEGNGIDASKGLEKTLDDTAALNANAFVVNDSTFKDVSNTSINQPAVNSQDSSTMTFSPNASSQQGVDDSNNFSTFGNVAISDNNFSGTENQFANGNNNVPNQNTESVATSVDNNLNSSVNTNQDASSTNGTSLQQALSTPDNSVLLDNSISVGSIPNSNVESVSANLDNKTDDNTGTDKKKGKISLPLVMLILIIVVSVGVIILRKDTIIDFFQTLINK